MESHRREMGDFQISQSKTLIEEGDIRTAYFYLRSGVTRSPGNLEGRLRLAEFYDDLFLSPEKALKTLRDGLPYAIKDNDISYIKEYIKALLNEGENKTVIELAQSELAKKPKDAEYQLLLALSQASAYYYENDYTRAQELIDAYDLLRTLEGTILAANIQWNSRNKDAAIQIIKDALTKGYPKDMLYDQLSVFYEYSGNAQAARHYAILRSLESPDAMDPRIDLLYLYHRQGKKKEELREIETVLIQFDNNAYELLQVASFASQTGNIELANRTYLRALEQGFPVASFTLALADTYINAGKPMEALAVLEQLDREQAVWLTRYSGLINGLRGLAHLHSGSHDIASAYVQSALEDTSIPIDKLVPLALEFSHAGGTHQAYILLLGANKRDPEDLHVLAELIALEISTKDAQGTLRPHLETLLTLDDTPDAKLLQNAYELLSSDTFLYETGQEALLNKLNKIIQKQPSTQATSTF
jgi:thioredoxin-like negative regulator of GroEL